jgi:hypothetical protein
MFPGDVVVIVWALFGHVISYWVCRIDLIRDAVGENDSPFLA